MSKCEMCPDGTGEFELDIDHRVWIVCLECSERELTDE